MPPSNTIEEKFTDLEERLFELEAKFIDPHCDPLVSPASYQTDLECYYVMCHAAFEEFFEELCISVLNEVEEKYIKTRRFSWATLCLLHFDTNNKNLLNDSWKNTELLSDYILDRIKVQKSAISTLAMKNNHGIGLKYLSKMFLPLGIDIPHDAKTIGSLEQLTTTRGAFAHSFSLSRNTTTRLLIPSDAVNCVMDIYQMAISLKRSAQKITYYKK